MRAYNETVLSIILQFDKPMSNEADIAEIWKKQIYLLQSWDSHSLKICLKYIYTREYDQFKFGAKMRVKNKQLMSCLYYDAIFALFFVLMISSRLI